MKKDTEFQEIGKRMPYKIPDGFFDRVSETTLLKAKQKEKNHTKIVTMWRVVAVAASLTGFALIGYYLSVPERSETTVAVAEKQEAAQPAVQERQQSAVTEPNTGAKKPQMAISEENKTKQDVKAEEQNNAEKFSDLLVDLSDEDLLQMAAMIKTDPFTELTSQ